MVNLFQVLLAVYHKLIQQILYTQWNGFRPHFYRLVLPYSPTGNTFVEAYMFLPQA